MDEELTALTELWILRFCEAPVLLDAELMRRVLAETEARAAGARTMTEKTFKAGDQVRWDHSQGTTTGRVIRKIVSPTRIKGHKVAASEDNPEYIVESDGTGARAAHLPTELRKT